MESKRWPKVPITELLSFIVDNRGKTVPTSETGFPLIATNCVLNERLYPVFDKIRYVDDETIRNWFRAHLQPNDILFVNKGTPGRCCLVPNPVTFCAAQDMVGLRCNPQKVYYKYLLMALRAPSTQKFISNYHVGIAIPHFKKEDFVNLLIPLPKMKEQRILGKLYFQICEAIENNTAICSDLESMAKLLYDYWFVQFDFPDENGKPYKSSGGKMVWNKELKREIPEGWEVKALKGLYNIERGLSYTSDDIASGSGVPMINLACIDRTRNYRDGELKYHNGKVPEDAYLHAGDLLIACTDLTREREIIGCPILVPDDGKKYTFSMDIAKISFPTNCIDELYMYMALRTNYYHNYIKAWASGTNVLHLNLEGLNWYKTIIPPLTLQKEFGTVVRNVHSKKSEILVENQQLASLRDFLLPMLMNGQVKVEAKGKEV